MLVQKIAIVHDWFTTYAGSEKVVEQLLQIYPQAKLFSLVDFLPPGERGFLGGRSVQTSILQRAPLARSHFRNYLGLMPLAIEQLDLSGYELIISNCHAVSKGLLSGPGQLHISYIHSPIRYAWDMRDEYLEAGRVRGLKAIVARLILHYIRGWDAAAAKRPDCLVANSHFIAGRIRKHYRRASTVIYPPVDTDYFVPASTPREDFYLTASRLVPYKHIDLIAETFRQMPDKRLVIIGAGPEAARVRRLCGANVTWLGFQPAEVLRDYMQRCRAFVFAAREDFGITPLEAQACGAPVIAFGEGGAKETIVGPENAEPTGIFFGEQKAASIRSAVMAFEEEPARYKPGRCRNNAQRFSNGRFLKEFRDFVTSSGEEFDAAAYKG
jgi:glycosyltransferase involved in cell wall biosynthesis